MHISAGIALYELYSRLTYLITIRNIVTLKICQLDLKIQRNFLTVNKKTVAWRYGYGK